VEEVTDEPLYRDRVCGSDIGKAGLVATIRVLSDRDPARRAAETRSFGTTRREVLALAGWLRCWQVPAVVMEATGDYGKGPSCRLEAEGFECVLADARQVRTCPAARSGIRLIRGGWRRASSAVPSRRVSWLPRSSGSSGCTPATGGT
jgi:transposase